MHFHAVNASGDSVGLCSTGVAEVNSVVNSGIAVVCCCNIGQYKRSGNGLCLGGIVVPSASGQPHCVAGADDRLVANHNIGKIASYGSVTERVAEADNLVTCCGVGTYADSYRVGVRNAVGHVAGDAVIIRLQTSEMNGERCRFGTADIHYILLHCGSSQRIDAHGECGVVGTVVSGSYRGSHLGSCNCLCKSPVEVPCTGRQCCGVAGTDDRLVADNNSSVVGIGNTLTVSVVHRSYSIMSACGRTQGKRCRVGVGHTVGGVARNTVVERGCACELYAHCCGLCAADILCCGVHRCGGTRFHGNLVSAFAVGHYTGVAATGMACFRTKTCGIRERGVASHSAGIEQIVAAVKQTACGIVTSVSSIVDIAGATAAWIARGRVARLAAAAAVPAAAAAATTGTRCALATVTALAERACLTINIGCCYCSVSIAAACGSYTSSCLSTWLSIIVGSTAVTSITGSAAAVAANITVISSATAATGDNNTGVERSFVNADIGTTSAATTLIC